MPRTLRSSLSHAASSCASLLPSVAGSPSPLNQPPKLPAAVPLGEIRAPSAFLQITPDNLITLTAPAIELGQGGHTSIATIMLEELDGDWQLLRVQDAPPAAVYNNPVFGDQVTGGDFTVRGWYVEARRIGAAARQMLVAAAARRWGVRSSECSTARSVVYHHASGRTCTFGSVATAAARLPVPQQPPLKPASQWTLVGKSPARVDIAEKVNGRAVYGCDVRLPGMLYAAVKACPTFGGRSAPTMTPSPGKCRVITPPSLCPRP